MKLPYEIICIDLETTDTDKNRGSMIQLGAVIVDKEFKILKRNEFCLYIKALDSFRNPKAMAVNRITEEQLDSHGVILQDALELFENFCENRKILAGWGGSYFDVPFLRKQYEKIGRKWPFGYKSIDLKSIAIWEIAKQDKPISGGVGRFLTTLGQDFEGNPHNAIDDIKNSIKILQVLKDENRKI